MSSKPRGLGTHVDRLLALEPGTDAAEKEQRRIEVLLMAALARGGRMAGERLVETVASHGYALERLPALPCFWRVVIPPPRVVEMWFTGGDDPAIAALSYRVGKPWGTKAQQRAARRQAEFYERYESLCGDEDPRSPIDRLLVLVGELEADVNNGGFGQYLGNKGTDRATEALAALETVGARRTARRLSAALKAGEGASFESLDRQFAEKPEDLPSLVMAYVAREEKRDPMKPRRRPRR